MRVRPRVFVEDFKRLFFRGLAALLPTVVTIAIFIWAFNWINQRIALPITDFIISVLPDPWARRLPINAEDALRYGQLLDELDPVTGRRLTLEHKIITHPACDDSNRDTTLRKEAQRRRAIAVWHVLFAKYKLNVVGFLIAVVLIYVVGFFLSGLLGRTTWRIVESAMLRVPVIRSVYPNIKQVTDFLFSERQLNFTGVVGVEYPRREVWSLGLVTGGPMQTIQRATNMDLITVFIPSSPTPFTGYTIIVPRSQTIELALTIDEALRFTISGGVIKPQSEGGHSEGDLENQVRDHLREDGPPA